MSAAQFGDFQLNGRDELSTAIRIMLLSDAPARPDDPVPPGERGGWWGDSYPDVPGFVIGSRLWMLRGRTITPALIAEAEDYSKEALQMLITFAKAVAVEVRGERLGDTMIGLAVSTQGPTDPGPVLRGVWEIHLG